MTAQLLDGFRLSGPTDVILSQLLLWVFLWVLQGLSLGTFHSSLMWSVQILPVLGVSALALVFQSSPCWPQMILLGRI